MNVAEIINLVIDIAWIVFGLLLAGGLVFWVSYWRQFKHEVDIREVCNNRKIKISKKARLFKDKDDITWWHIRGYPKLKLVAVPPAEVVEITNKGRQSATLFMLGDGAYMWGRDPTKFRGIIPESISKIKDIQKREDALKDYCIEHNIISALQPFPTNQRQIAVNQCLKAQSRKKKGWQEYIIPIAGLGALVIICVSLFIFYPDMLKPAMLSTQERTAQLQIQKETIQLLKDIKLDVQTFTNENVRPVEAPN